MAEQGAAGAAAAAAAVQVSKTTGNLQRYHDGFVTRLHGAVDSLMENYAAMIKAARLPEVRNPNPKNRISIA